MKKYLLFFTLLPFISFGQHYIKFEENGLMNNSNAFGALLCPVTKEKASEIFQVAANLKLSSKHINGYCEARADFITRKIASLYHENGCDVGKIWVFAPSISTLVSKQSLVTDDLLFTGDKINWDYHVAPMISVKTQTSTGEKIDTVVIDLSFSNEQPIEYHAWLSKMNSPAAIYTFTDKNYYQFYTLNGLRLNGSAYAGVNMAGNFPKVITGHFYYLLLGDNTTVPSGLAGNDLATRLAEKYYADPAFAAYKEKIKECTRQNQMASLVAGTFAGLPPEIVNDAQQYYQLRLQYWKSQW